MCLRYPDSSQYTNPKLRLYVVPVIEGMPTHAVEMLISSASFQLQSPFSPLYRHWCKRPELVHRMSSKFLCVAPSPLTIIYPLCRRRLIQGSGFAYCNRSSRRYPSGAGHSQVVHSRYCPSRCPMSFQKSRRQDRRYI